MTPDPTFAAAAASALPDPAVNDRSGIRHTRMMASLAVAYIMDDFELRGLERELARLKAAFAGNDDEPQQED